MKSFVFTGMLVLLGFCALAQDKQAILSVLDNQRIAWNKGDIDGFMQSYWKSDSLLFVGKTGPNYGWQTTIDHYKKAYPDKATMGTLAFDVLKVDVLDKTNAFVLGAWHLKRDKDPVGGFFTLWFKKIKGVWLIVADHTS